MLSLVSIHTAVAYCKVFCILHCNTHAEACSSLGATGFDPQTPVCFCQLRLNSDVFFNCDAKVCVVAFTTGAACCSFDKRPPRAYQENSTSVQTVPAKAPGHVLVGDPAKVVSFPFQNDHAGDRHTLDRFNCLLGKRRTKTDQILDRRRDERRPSITSSVRFFNLNRKER